MTAPAAGAGSDTGPDNGTAAGSGAASEVAEQEVGEPEVGVTNAGVESRRRAAERFYAGAPGDALGDPRLLPGAVRRYLALEAELVAAFVPPGGTLVEVGCMDGLHLDLAADRGLRYIGVDIVERYAEAGRRRIAALAEAGRGRRPPHLFLLADAARLDAELSGRLEEGEEAATRVVFPFNSIGNMQDLDAVLAALRRLGLPFLLGSYRTTERAGALRREYYASCGSSLRGERVDRRGVAFLVDEGHEIVSFHPAYLHLRAGVHGLRLRRVDLSELGVAYAGFLSSSGPGDGSRGSPTR